MSQYVGLLQHDGRRVACHRRGDAAPSWRSRSLSITSKYLGQVIETMGEIVSARDRNTHNNCGVVVLPFAHPVVRCVLFSCFSHAACGLEY